MWEDRKRDPILSQPIGILPSSEAPFCIIQQMDTDFKKGNNFFAGIRRF
jgi:hypothetical protein